MRYLLDTCAFIDALMDPEMLGPDVQALLQDYDNEFCISQETLREVILKYKHRHLWTETWTAAEEIVDAIYDASIFTVLPIRREHLKTYATLIPNEAEGHKDPSDHLIIAHAITNRLPLISRDRKFHYYCNQGLNLIYYGRK